METTNFHIPDCSDDNMLFDTGVEKPSPPTFPIPNPNHCTEYTIPVPPGSARGWDLHDDDDTWPVFNSNRLLYNKVPDIFINEDGMLEGLPPANVALSDIALGAILPYVLRTPATQRPIWSHRYPDDFAVVDLGMAGFDGEIMPYEIDITSCQRPNRGDPCLIDGQNEPILAQGFYRLSGKPGRERGDNPIQPLPHLSRDWSVLPLELFTRGFICTDRRLPWEVSHWEFEASRRARERWNSKKRVSAWVKGG